MPEPAGLWSFLLQWSVRGPARITRYIPDLCLISALLWFRHNPSSVCVCVCVCVLIFWRSHVASRILVLWPGIEPVPSALEAWSPNHWTAREVSSVFYKWWLKLIITHKRYIPYRDKEKRAEKGSWLNYVHSKEVWLQVMAVISSVVQMAVDQHHPIEVSITVEMSFTSPAQYRSC